MDPGPSPGPDEPTACDVQLAIDNAGADFLGGGEACDGPGPGPLSGIVNVGVSPEGRNTEYRITANTLSGYAATFSGDCAEYNVSSIPGGDSTNAQGGGLNEVIIQTGEHKRCRITYTKVDTGDLIDQGVIDEVHTHQSLLTLVSVVAWRRSFL